VQVEAVPEAFENAALRHWSDAVLLGQKQRLANADQLLGLAAECAIKSALMQLPGCSDAGRLRDTYRDHVDRLWSRLALQGLQKRFPALSAYVHASNPFADWSVSQRYGSDSEVTATTHEKHLQAARRLLGAVGLLGVRAGASA
jgi:hypothetical protein